MKLFDLAGWDMSMDMDVSVGMDMDMDMEHYDKEFRNAESF